MKIVITVPGHLSNNNGVAEAIGLLLEKSGGVTVCPAQGQWLDPHGALVLEPVEQYHFCFAGPDTAHDWGTIDHAVHCVAMALFEAGEQAVLVEHFGRGYRCNIFTKEQFT